MPRLTTLRPRLATLDTSSAKLPPKIADDFYASPAWRKLVARLVMQRGRRCEDCGRKGIRVYGDHIVERADGGPELDPSNVRLLCGSCHTLKTHAARAARMIG